MKNLDSRLLKKFLKAAGNSLKGEWLLVGGTLLPALGLDLRSTVDIDLVGLGKKEQEQTLELMELAESLGLQVSTINQAATFFVNKIGYKKSDLLPLYKGKSARIYRPSVELYWALKVSRLTESDLLDCQHYFHYCIGQKDGINIKKLLTLTRSSNQPYERHQRLQILRELASHAKV